MFSSVFLFISLVAAESNADISNPDPFLGLVLDAYLEAFLKSN